MINKLLTLCPPENHLHPQTPLPFEACLYYEQHSKKQ